MSYISSIRLNNFRNLGNQEVNLSNLANVFIGPNGAGKTNLIESVSLISPGRGLKKEILNKISNFNSKDPWVIHLKYNKKNMPVLEIACTYEVNKTGTNTKRILINGNKEKKIFEQESIPNLIWFTPDMERLFNGSPSLRRNFIDRIVFSFDKKILIELNSYTKLLKERKKILETINFDENWLNEVENKIVLLGTSIIKKRIHTIYLLNEIFDKKFESKKLNNCNLNITGYIEELYLDRKNINFEEVYLNELKKSRNSDRFKGGCSVGPHKSDFKVLFRKNKIYAEYCSTGQQKEIILNILLCQAYALIQKNNTSPIVLLDEICSHLDETTRSILLYFIEWLKIQVLMTGNDEKLFSFLSKKAKFFYVKDGIVNY